MKEGEFNAKEFASSVQYLEQDYPRILTEKVRTGDQGTEQLLGHPNSITKIRGYVLRQEALLRAAEYELLVEKNVRGRRLNKADIVAAKAAFDQAKARFCEFLKNAYYVD